MTPTTMTSTSSKPSDTTSKYPLSINRITKVTPVSKPWRKSRSEVLRERVETQDILSCRHPKSKCQLPRAIIFCYEADKLIDVADAGTCDIERARQAVQEFRQAVTNDRAHDTGFVEDCRAAAAASLKDIGLESSMRAALAIKSPGKWPVMHEVIPGLWCGGWTALNDNCRALEERGITRVVSVVSADKRSLPKAIISDHLHIYAHDDEKANLLQHFSRIVSFVDDSLKMNAKVYIHCGAGVSRAPTATTAYIMWRYKIPAAESLAIVKKSRPAARPNINFINQLVQWEDQIDCLLKSSPPKKEKGTALTQSMSSTDIFPSTEYTTTPVTSVIVAQDEKTGQSKQGEETNNYVSALKNHVF